MSAFGPFPVWSDSYHAPGATLTTRAVAARESAASKPPPIGATIAPTSSAPPKAKPTAAPAKKDPKKSLKGVLVKKKHKATATASDAQESAPKDGKTKAGENADRKSEGDERETKRRKVSAT